MKKKITQRKKRHSRIRKKISGTQDRPRLSVYRSSKNLFVQLVNDQRHSTLLFFSTLGKDFKGHGKSGGNIKAATILGEIIANKARQENIKKIVFDRGGYLYHGRIKALADVLRKGGLEF